MYNEKKANLHNTDNNNNLIILGIKHHVGIEWKKINALYKLYTKQFWPWLKKKKKKSVLFVCMRIKGHDYFIKLIHYILKQMAIALKVVESNTSHLRQLYLTELD